MNYFYLLLILLALNITQVIIMYLDKKRAIKGEERIPEVILFFTALFFAGIGFYVSMFILRHKIRKWYFHVGALMIIIQNCCTIYVFLKLLKII